MIKHFVKGLHAYLLRREIFFCPAYNSGMFIGTSPTLVSLWRNLSDVYIVLYVIRPLHVYCTMCEQYACDLTTHADPDDLLRAVLLLVLNIQITLILPEKL